ncbi:alpha/beta hydrolase fold protein [Mycobacterium lentiflavum]|uniref:Alpha/beta hydrolase fold protein n=1 Tax=Mycobacterium lentiflavum TaxID=141349 RepID=A0A0E4CP22_MYCLN|nr:alpha/beta fold hydrolase [Mycobacterium lentiflavum]CQD16635.1 alpha/beta hydrolase fold protein [Mycobacterium lentiflavum]
MLEVIEKGPGRDSAKPPVLFVHGAWHGAWYWDEHFLDFFAEKGYRSLAVSLRSHGKSAEPKRNLFCSIADYVDDVASVANALPTPPIVVGHSLGGFVVQKYLESHEAPAAVLLASAPPSGVTGFMLRLGRRHPWHTARTLLTTKSLHGVGGTPKLAREHFYSRYTPEADVVRYTAPLGEEYAGRWFLDMLLLNLPKPDQVNTAVLILGAEDDGCFTPREVHQTARAYGTTAEIFPNMGHNMMVEPGWALVAARIHAWLADVPSLRTTRQTLDAVEERRA